MKIVDTHGHTHVKLLHFLQKFDFLLCFSIIKKINTDIFSAFWSQWDRYLIAGLFWAVYSK